MLVPPGLETALQTSCLAFGRSAGAGDMKSGKDADGTWRFWEARRGLSAAAAPQRVHILENEADPVLQGL